ncbi:MAG TPA: GHKL domain-containing protein [Candidatus Bacteroides pullicola]|uniref:histidine kinase n=1 Tax=Candidatus Bacteroides pullicola TaxID=2838475 RepID=A0A9D2CLL1_9BACE|nr:GHKL domain-containing protein [Candidatus Bacteroides pullicola]
METTEQLKQQVENLQEQLKQQEKLASLGLLTAGIVHEIRNPLNFVINFGKLSRDLIKELGEDLEDVEKDVDQETLEDIRDIMASLDENLQKIKEHGERAISIIQNILLYSRGKEDERIPTDVCKLVKEYVWLSYHAMRANLKDFNISVEEQYDEGIPLQSVVPQDLSRAVLNVMNNACYAVWEKSQTGLKDYKPTVSVKVARQGNELAISITDNGTGMSAEVKQRLFDTFFTTKPTGQGTGLGMYITRKIIEEKHQGRIEFDSEHGQFTTFTLIIPLKA